MKSPIPVYIINSKLPNQTGRLMALNLCELLESIIPGQVMGSQYFNGIWSIWIKTKEARQHLAELGSIEINNINNFSQPVQK